jgi:hypothetical protein
MSNNLTTESTAEKRPRRKGKILRVFRWALCLIILLIGGLFLYALASEKQEPIETGEPHMKAGTLKSLLLTTTKFWSKFARLHSIHLTGTSSKARPTSLV